MLVQVDFHKKLARMSRYVAYVYSFKCFVLHGMQPHSLQVCMYTL